MKRFACFCLALMFCFVLFGCTNEPDEPEETAVEWETVLLEKNEYLYGEIIEIQAPDVLVLKLRTPKFDWGDTIYVVTEDAEKWCVGDDVELSYSSTQYASNDPDSKRIVATWVKEPYLVEKPILYFYPEVSMVCSAKVTLNGELTCTYPAHGADGWKDFVAHPDGTLVFPDGKRYYALYWEGLQKAEWDFSRGFCVRGEDTAAFLEWALAEQGLNEREANEFIIYWLPQMQDAPYNVISFQTEAYTEGAALEITPAPDSLLRVFMTYYPTDAEVEIAPQTFEGFPRQGFTVVEWGGSLVRKP
ncbi:MAG: hypothetical protein IJX19_13090 [Clostridia bacterium]|nr:hypothetical protein [Clostridia bacterium]